MVSSGAIIAEGAEARVSRADVLGMPAVAKERMRKSYRIERLDSAIRTQRTKDEARAMAIASNGGVNVPPVLMVMRHTIFMGLVEGTLLREAIAHGSRDAVGLMERAGEQVGRMHLAGVLHGDCTPANMLVGTDGRIHIIDFGLAEISTSEEGRAVDLLLMKRYVSLRLYRGFVVGYSRANPGSAAALRRLAEIERRGRYQSRTLAVL